MKKTILYLSVLILLTSCSLIFPTTTDELRLPDGFQLEELDIDVDEPTDISFTADGRMLVGGKKGQVWLFEKNATGGEILFTNIAGMVNQSRDRGLTSVRAHPDFPNTPYIYILFTYDPPEAGLLYGNANETGDPRGVDGEGQRLGRLVRVTADATKDYSVAVANSMVTLVGKNSIWENIGNPAETADSDRQNWSCHINAEPDGETIPDCLPADAVTHTVGSIGFGPDGALFLSQGDGATYLSLDGRAYRSYDLNSLAGKILRVDPITGKGLPDNPYWDGNPDSNRSKIYSIGLRNPFRFSIHPQTGEPWVGDVGWNDWEEINQASPSADFGWPCFEGAYKNGLALAEKQSQYKNTVKCIEYFKTEQSRSPLYAWYRGNGGGAAIGGAFYTGALEQVLNAEDKVVFPESYTSAYFFGDFDSGAIDYLTVDSDNSVKRERFGIDVDTDKKRLRFTGMAVAPDGSLYIVSPTPEHKNNSIRRIIYSDKLIVKSPPPNDLPIVSIDSHNDGDRFTYGERVDVFGSAVDIDGNEIASEQLEWTGTLQHFGHPHNYFESIGSNGNFALPNHEDAGYLQLCLEATDVQGRVGESCIDLEPIRTTLTLQSSPSGILLSYIDAGSITNKITPFSKNDVVVNNERRISAPQYVTIAGESYRFKAWEHEGVTDNRMTLSFQTKNTPMTYTAIYELE